MRRSVNPHALSIRIGIVAVGAALGLALNALMPPDQSVVFSTGDDEGMKPVAAQQQELASTNSAATTDAPTAPTFDPETEQLLQIMEQWERANPWQ